MVSIDEAIKFLQRARQKIGGDKLLILSLTGSGIEDVEVTGLVLINEAKDPDGSRYVEVRASHPALQVDG